MTALVILALVALFVGLRLYSVLGERTGHEQKLAKEPEAPVKQPEDPKLQGQASAGDDAGNAFLPLAGPGVRALLAADPGFDVARFLEGAEGAYRMILEAFWKGELDDVRPLVGDEVYEAFAGAVDDREAAKLTLDNRLVHIDQSVIAAAELTNMVAEVTVRFDADIAAITRNEAGDVVAGSLDDAVQTHDRWTFRRDIASDDPNWILVETDEEE